MLGMKMMEAIEWRAKEFAKAKHDATGVIYNDLPYFDGHVVGVRQIGADHGLTGGLWGARLLAHDTIEDTDTTREELRRLFGLEVELPVWCVTGVGETRKIRNADIYRKIVAYDEVMDDHAAAIVKCCDRTFHFENTEPGTGYFKMYQKELPAFAEVVRPRVPEEMWNRLERAANRG